MPVNTGRVPDEIVGDGDGDNPELPESVAGLAPLAAEVEAKAAAADGGLFVEVRDHKFRLRSALPGMLIMDLADKQSKLKGGVGDQQSQAAVFAALGRSMTFLVVAEERESFAEFLIEAEPPIEIDELIGGEDGGVLGRMMEVVSGRPTQSVSG
jgi:hypothetical protein